MAVYIGTLEAVWRVQDGFAVQVLGSYRRYTWRATRAVIASMLDKGYVGDKYEWRVDAGQVVSAALHAPLPTIARPDLYRLGMLAELAEVAR